MSQTRVSQARVSQTRVSQTRVSQTRMHQPRVSQTRVSQTRMHQPRFRHARRGRRDQRLQYESAVRSTRAESLPNDPSVPGPLSAVTRKKSRLVSPARPDSRL